MTSQEAFAQRRLIVNGPAYKSTLKKEPFVLSVFLTCFTILALLPSLGFAQKALPTYQSIAERQVCTVSVIFDHPGGTPIAQAVAGDVIAINDVSFGPDGALFFQFGEEQGPRFIASADVAHFCGYSDRASAQPIAFLAPPNTCHLIAASRRTLEEVNRFVTDRAANAAVMNVFRAQNGWYAISLGEVSLAAAELVLSQGQGIPDDAYCSDGANYFDIMDRRDGQFVELDPPAPADPVTRMAEAIDLSVNRTDENSAVRLRRSCLLGNGRACGLYADLPPPPGTDADAVAQDQTRFDLLGCMLGEVVACNNVLFGQGLQNRALFAAFPDRTGADSAPPMLNPELAKVGCDAGLAPSCWELAKPIVEYGIEAIPDYLTSLQATFSACITAQIWYCQMFEDQMSRRQSAMETSWQPAALFGAAQAFSTVCQVPGNVDSTGCRIRYGRYNGFIKSDDGTQDQDLTAALAIRNGCDANSITACAYQSGLSTYFPLIDRRLAAAKVMAACGVVEDRPETCDRLIKLLGTDLPEAQGPIRQEYEARADLCRSTQGTDGSNPCRDALMYYGNNISNEDIAEPLALLRDTCSDAGKITGCEMLARYYNGEKLSFTEAGVRKSWPKQPQMVLETLQTGCIATLEAVGNCGALGLTYELQGDFDAATQAYTLGCDTGMTASDDQFFGQGRVCYWAAKHARNNTQDYANARRWFNYDCYAGDEPFACKFLGLMHAQAKGGDTDPLTAMTLYRHACYLTDDITLGDGQACFLYGQLLVTWRGGVIYDGATAQYRTAMVDVALDEVIIENLSAASKAFFRGCLDDRAESCAAHETLLADWVKGIYPTEAFDCRLMDATGQMTPAKPCQHLPHYMSLPGDAEDEGWANIFVWPDGDRTVTSDNDGAPYLNGAAADWIFPEGGWECLRNRNMGRSFCYAMS